MSKPIDYRCVTQFNRTLQCGVRAIVAALEGHQGSAVREHLISMGWTPAGDIWISEAVLYQEGEAAAPPPLAEARPVVDEAMVERALNARVRSWAVHEFMSEDGATEVMRAALTAAFAQQGGRNDDH